MSTATASIRLYLLDKLQTPSGYRSCTSLSNTCRISLSSTAKYGYHDSVREYVHSLDIDDQRRAHRTGRMKLHAGKDPHPEPPASPKSSSVVGWLYGVILATFTLIIPLSTAGKRGPLLVFKKKMESVMETVEDVTEAIEDVAEIVDQITDKVSEHLPEKSRLKHALDKIDDAAEKTIEATDFAQEILEKKMVSNAQIETMLQGQQQAIADAVRQAIQAVAGMGAAQGVQAGNGAGGGGGDPFAKRLKAFADVGVTKFSGDEGVLESQKWLDHALRMLPMMESVTTERARRELLSHQMTGNALSWWRTQERLLGEDGLATLTVQGFRERFEARYVSEAQKRKHRRDFLHFEQGERTVEQYTTRFHELSTFAPGIAEDEAEMKAMYVEGLRRSIRHVMPDPSESTMTQLYNRAVRAERDDFRPHKGQAGGRYRPYDQTRQGGGRGRDFRGRGHHGRGGFRQGNRDQRVVQAQPMQARQQPLALPAPVLAAHGGPQQQQQGGYTCRRCGDPSHFVRTCPWWRLASGELVPHHRTQQQQHQQQPQQPRQQQHQGRGGGRGGRGGGRNGGREGFQQQGGRGQPVLAAIPAAVQQDARGDFQDPGHGGGHQHGVPVDQ